MHATTAELEPLGAALPSLTPPPAGSRDAAGARTAVRLWPATAATALISCAVSLYATGGLSARSMTITEICLTVGCGLLAAACLLVAAPGTRWHGLSPLAMLALFTVLTAISVAWSVQPDESWRDASRMLAYTAVFGAAIALVRVARPQWPAILGGLTLAATVICAYALATKVFPATLDPSDKYARLQEPYGYWNAVGLTAAMGALGCLWLGTRRAGHALLSALAYPALGLMLLTLVLAYSRGALLALAAGAVLWLIAVPLRLRTAALLIVAGAGAGAAAAWDFSTHALSAENVALAQRTSAGHRLGAVVLAMTVVLAVAGVAIGFATARRPPSRLTRRRAAIALVSLMAVAVLAFAGALAHSQRGLFGSISHAASSLTNPNLKTPPNTPDRLTAIASVRARYWKEALQVWKAHPLLGSGAAGYRTARLRYRTESLSVIHAHGFLVQTLADLGLLGLAIALILLGCWISAAARTSRPLGGRLAASRALRRLRGAAPEPASEEPYTAERIGMLAMLCIVVTFGVHSTIDWTWYVPGDACAALLLAGWLAGRGPLRRVQPRPLALRAVRPSGVRAAIAAAAVAGALLAAWAQWQPQRAEETSKKALALQARGLGAAAQAQARKAVSQDPLSAEALITLAAIQGSSGEHAASRATLESAVRLQPSNPKTWLALGEFDLESDPQDALHELQASIYLNPQAISPELLSFDQREAVTIYNDLVKALRETSSGQ